MNVAGNDLAENNTPESIGTEEHSAVKKFLLTIVSILPWAIVGTLLWAGIFVKPTAIIEEVVSAPINVRDNIFGVAHVDGDVYLAAGNYGKMLITKDGGKTWENQDSTVSEHLMDISAWDENRAVAVGNAGVTLMTEDGGVTWVSVDSPKSDVANKLLKVHTYPDGEALAVGEMGMIIRSLDYGKTWTMLREENDIFMNDVVKVDANTIWVSAEYGQIFKSIDNGETWEELFTDSPNSFAAIDAKNPLEITIVGLAGVVVSTLDGGETWTYIAPEQSGMTEHLMDVQWSDAINRWVAIGNKGKWMTFTSDLKDFQPMNISSTDYTSHTEMVIVGGKGLAVGATVGSLDLETKTWSLYAE
ncbi:MAG: YCF48-related protein [Porticoccus sp.]